jgi:hypothetical protein
MDHLMEPDDLTDALLELGHGVFMVMTWLFTALTLFVVGLALYRLLPKRPRSAVPAHDDEEPR